MKAVIEVLLKIFAIFELHNAHVVETKLSIKVNAGFTCHFLASYHGFTIQTICDKAKKSTGKIFSKEASNNLVNEFKIFLVSEVWVFDR